MATIAPRHASALRARALSRTWLLVPAGLAALVLLSLVLRTRELGVGFWIDEGLSVGISDRPLGDIPDALRLDGSPPLYYMLLHVWMAVAGTSEEAVRALSVACALLTVPVAWWAAHGLWGTRAGWMAAVLAATNPFLTQYAQEGRMYALLALLALVASAAFARAFAWRGRGWAIAYAVVLAAMLYTHNWALFFGAACGLVWLYLAVALGRAARRRSSSARSPSAARWRCTCRGSRPRSTRRPTPARRGRSRRPSSPCSGRPSRCSGSSRRWRSCSPPAPGSAVLLRRPGRSPAAWLLAIALLTVTLAWMSSQLSPAWANRYLAVAAAPLLLAVAAGLAHAGPARDRRPGRRRRAGGRRHGARRQEQRARGGAHDRARACVPATSWSRPSPSRCPCSTTTCPRACASRRSPAR